MERRSGLRTRLLSDVAAENYKLASAEKGERFARLAVAGTAHYLREFIDNAPV